MSCRFIVLAALAAGILASPAWAQDDKKQDEKKQDDKQKVVTKHGKTQAEWTKILETDKDKLERKKAVRALRDFGTYPAEVVTALSRALEKDPEVDIRLDIANMIGTLSVQDVRGAVDVLAQRLEDKDENPRVKEAAARSLGRLADVAGPHMPRLAKAMKDPDRSTSIAAAEALVLFDEKVAPVMPQLLEVAGDPKIFELTRATAVRILTRLAAKDIAKKRAPNEMILKVFAGIVTEQSPHFELRQSTVGSLSSMGAFAASAVDALAKTFEFDKWTEKDNKDQFQELRRVSGAALARIGPKAASALPSILKVTSDPETSLRIQAVRLAGMFGRGNADVTKQFVKLLKEERNSETLVAVIQEAAELGIQEAVATLNELANDPRMSVRDAAKASLTSLKKVKS